MKIPHSSIPTVAVCIGIQRVNLKPFVSPDDEKKVFPKITNTIIKIILVIGGGSLSRDLRVTKICDNSTLNDRK